MRIFESFALSPGMLFRKSFALALLTILPFSSLAIGSQNPPPKKKPPILTNDDLVRPKSEQTVEEGEGVKDATEKEASAQAGKGKENSDEASWRERVKQARDRAKEAERQAEEAELGLTELRNQLGASGGTAKDRNDTAAALDEAGKKLLELRSSARTAKADLEKLLDYGREKGFTEGAGPSSTTEAGEPNEEYYRARYQKLKEEVAAAERRIELQENRVRDFNQRITSSSGTGDNFFIAQLAQDRDEAQKLLDEAREARDKSRGELESLLEEARRAGIPPGVFR